MVDEPGQHRNERLVGDARVGGQAGHFVGGSDAEFARGEEFTDLWVEGDQVGEALPLVGLVW